ncbi:glycoside hydrolase family 43 protein [Acinetobacter radioresistens]|uniref:hypothetical protein n=1 Tax=Acinetobacter radioresistens TaxID=40216 RepID=UPI0020069124|nr:hypothetical protein [Acinetobacter radioresistens]MCK4111582.1 glycoside hydrolase family 43 protein [Acinetobacter radioresistens]
MAEDIKTSVENFNTDAQTAEEVVNGNESGKVMARLGREYPTLPAAIQRILDMGGMDAFATESALKASIPTTSTKIAYAADTQKIWRWARTSEEGVTPITGTWTDTGKSPIDQAKADATAKANTAEDNAKEYTDLKKAEAVELAAKKLNEIVDHSKDEPILRIYDNELSIVAEIDKASQLRLPDLEYSVQEEINQQKKTASHGGNINDFIHVFSDIEGEVVAGIDKEGGLHLVGSTVPLQEKLNWQKVKLPARQFNERDLFVESANKYILNMSISGNQNAPIPFNLIPQNYTVPDSFVNNYSLNPPTKYLPINTPYGNDDRVVHPYVIEFPGNFRGFRYLMCITPYTVEAHENPVIMGSNDLERWEMLTGFDQPLASPRPGRFLSDNGLAYDPTSGMLICYWRDGITNSSDDTNIYYRATRDGTEWTNAQLLFAADPTSSNLSPSVLFNPVDGLWHMWIGETSGWWRHYTSKTLNNKWTLKSIRSFLDKGLWHSEVKFLGDKYVMLINKRDPDSNFYFAVSSNGDDWLTGNYLFNIQQNALYKASFLPRFNDAGEMAFDIFYTTNHAEGSAWYRKFFHLTTNFAEI